MTTLPNWQIAVMAAGDITGAVAVWVLLIRSWRTGGKP